MDSSDEFAIPQTILRYFDFTSLPYTDAYAREVAERRRVYPGGVLFLDQLFAAASIEASSLYPPTSPAGLRRLIHAVRSSQIDRLKQDCFIYYLLLDSDHASKSPIPNGNGYHEDDGMDGGDSRSDLMRVDKGKGKAIDEGIEQAEEFARKRCLPQVWRGFIFGYWSLDHELWEQAVHALSNPSISQLDFLPEIFAVLSTRVSPPSTSLSLIHSFFTAVSPPLSSEALISLRAISLASASSLSDAFSFIRAQPPADQQKLRETIYAWALGAPRIPCGLGKPVVQGGVVTQLLHIPLLADETTHLIDFLTHPPRSIPSPALDLLHELVTVRLIHQGQYAECLALDKELAGSGAGKEEDRQKRRERVKEFISILPETQRRVLELDVGIRRAVEESNGSRARNEDVDMPSAGTSSGSRQAIPNGESSSQIVAPIPTRLPSSLSLAGNASTSTRPSVSLGRIMTLVSRNVSSPFSGPPQFARKDSPSNAPGTPGRATSINRIASGSPFALPPRIQVEVEVPRPARRIIDDDEDGMDEDDVMGVLDTGRKRRQSLGRSMAPTPTPTKPSKSKQAEAREEAEVAPESASQPLPPPRENQHQQQQQDTSDMPPPPVPAQSQSQPVKPTTARKSSRQPSMSKAPPRQTSPDQHPQTQPADPKPMSRSRTQRSVAHAETKPPPKTNGVKKSEADEANGEGSNHADPHTVMPGSFTHRRPPPPSPSATSGRSRMTRSASRAVLDEDTPNPGPAAKKARTKSTAQSKEKAGSPTPSADGDGETKRRMTRRGTRELSVASSRGNRSSVTPGPEVQGRRGASPTGSVASARSTRGAGREGSITPRVTRTRK